MSNNVRFINQLYLFILFFVMMMIASCKTSIKTKENKVSEWNSGIITIATDENLKNIAEQLAQIYEHENPSAKINFNYQPQDKIITNFINGNITSMLISRMLTNEERKTSLQNQQAKTIENIFGYNAIALITHPTFKDSIFDIKNLQNYLQPNSAVKLVFDNKQSGIAKYLIQLQDIDAQLFKNAFVVNNASEVIEYVQRNQTSIGFIPFNLISNRDDEETEVILKKIKILAIKQNDTICKISQDAIYNFTYPLQQSINIVLGKNPELVGTGFTNFLTKQQSAKILLRAGLVPAYMPNRSFEISDELKVK
jgi:phosphate transport system substrate-binding protein